MPEGSNQPLDAEHRRLLAVMRNAMRAAKNTVLNPPGKTDAAKAFNVSRAAAQLRDLNKQLAAMNVQAKSIMSAALQKSYARGIADAERLMKEAGLSVDSLPVKGGLLGADARRAAVLVRNAQTKIDATFKSISNVAGRAVRESRALGLDNAKLRQLLAGGTVTGASKLTLQRVREMMKKIAQDGLVEVPTRGGRVITFKPDYYADLVYQTTMAEAAEKAEHERMIREEQFYVKIFGSNSLNFCTAFVGKVFYIGPGSDPLGRYPHYKTLPRGGAPFHPHCTKRSVPFIVDFATAAELAKAEPDDNTKSLLVPDPTEAQKAYEQQQKDAKVEKKPDVVASPPDLRAAARDARRRLREIGEGTAETDRRLEAEHKQLTDQVNRAIEAGDNDKLAEIEPAWTKVVQEQQRLAEVRRKAARAILAVEKPASTVIKSTLTGHRRDRVREGVEELSKMVDQRLLPSINVVAKPLEKGKRARSYYRGGTIYMSPTAPVDVVIHELGHLIEDLSPTLHRAALQFLQRRTDGEKLELLSKLTKIKAYRSNERARPDDFFDPYVGKDYGGLYTEIISMGIQYLWRDPIAFAAKDADFFEFIFRVLRGDFRD